MPKTPKLSDKLLLKMSNGGNGSVLSVRKAVSARASKLHISPQAALVIMAHELGFRTTVYERGLSPGVQEQIRSYSIPQVRAREASVIKPAGKTKTGTANKIGRKRPWWEHPWLLTIGSSVIAGLILAYIFGVGR